VKKVTSTDRLRTGLAASSVRVLGATLRLRSRATDSQAPYPCLAIDRRMASIPSGSGQTNLAEMRPLRVATHRDSWQRQRGRHVPRAEGLAQVEAENFANLAHGGAGLGIGASSNLSAGTIRGECLALPTSRRRGSTTRGRAASIGIGGSFESEWLGHDRRNPHDKHVRTRPGERNALVAHGVRAFVLTSAHTPATTPDGRRFNC
jgi:hypothetical protein